MRRIKDFFYNKNDILIVLIIVAAAAFIIYTRIEAIMAYPETVVKEASQNGTEVVQQEDSIKTEEPSEASETSEEGNTTVHITIDDTDTSISVSEALAEAGLVSSAEEFESYINNMDKAGSIQSGTFEIPSGSTDEEILNIIAQ